MRVNTSKSITVNIHILLSYHYKKLFICLYKISDKKLSKILSLQDIKKIALKICVVRHTKKIIHPQCVYIKNEYAVQYSAHTI